MREFNYKKWCLDHLEHPCPLFQVIGAVTKFYYLKSGD